MKNTAQIIQFQAFKAEQAERRIDTIIELVAMPFLHTASDMTYEEGTGDLIATAEEWAHYEKVHGVFGLTLPAHVSASALVGSIVYLVSHLGSMIKLRAQNEKLYEILRKTRTSQELACIDSFFDGTLTQTRELTQALRPLDKRPSDFA